jgi:hypothetical protein
MVVRHLEGVSPLDRYEPTRSYGNVMIEEIGWPLSGDGWTGVELEIINGLDVYKHARRALWLIDFGPGDVRPYYTCTYHETERHVGLKSYPSGLESAPLTTYYVKVTEVPQ